MPDDGVEVKVLGLAEMSAGAKGVADRIAKSAGPSMATPAARVADSVRGAVPRLSGALAGSVTYGSEDDSSSFVGMGEGLEYAGWIEYGGTRGRPYYDQGRYVYPAAQAHQSLVVGAAEKQAETEIARYPWTRPPSN